MSEVLQFVVLGMAVGAVYALTAQGLVLIYRGSGVVNFAQGAYGVVGAFLFYKLQAEGLAVPLVWAVAIGVPVVLGIATHTLVLARLARASALVRLSATLGVMLLVVAVAHQIWGRQSEPVLSPLPQTIRRPFGDVVISEDRLWIIGIAVVVTAVLWAVFRWTSFGRQTEAVAENQGAAAALGISPHRIAVINWGLGAALAAVAAILVAPILMLHVEALAFIVLRSLAAALVGRFRYFWWTLAGAFGIGIVESLLSRYITDSGLLAPLVSSDGLLFNTFSAQSTSRSAAFLIIIVMMVVAGRGLPMRGELFDRLPSLGNGRIRPVWLVAGLLVAGYVVVAGDATWTTALMISGAYAIIVLSVIVVSGFTGQLSLTQMALAGFAAWVAGRLVQVAEAPFVVALVIGVLVTLPLGVLLALPALRTRGANLALLTFGLAVVIYELILQNSAVTGGLEGTIIGRISLFGLNIDALEHPERYATVVIVVLVLLGLMVANLRRGLTGLRLIAVRNNERAAASVGLSVYEIKLYAFSVATLLAAAGGILLAFRDRTIVYTTFAPFESIKVVVFAVIGGIGFVTGALYAALFAPSGLGSEILHLFGFGSSTIDIISGAVLLITILTNPSGVAHGNTMLWNTIKKRSTRNEEPPTTSPPAAHPPLDSPRAATPPVASPPVTNPPVHTGDAALHVRDLSVRFGGVVAVNGLNLAVHAGEVVGLIGPNGAGKTTVLDALTGYVTPDTGVSITVNGTELSRLSPAKRARAGLSRSFQSLELFDDLTIGQNLAVAADAGSRRGYLRDLIAPAEVVLSPQAQSAVDAFDLADVLNELPEELSYGRRRLVAIARAIAAAPTVLLLDEPAAGLSEHETTELGRLVRKLADEQHMAILLIEHDMSLVMTICDQLLVIDHGTPIATGTTNTVAHDPRVVAAYLGEPTEPTGDHLTGTTGGNP